MRIAFVTSCLLASSLAFAQSTTKPGLWEITNKMSSPTNPQLSKQIEEAQKTLAAMPPAQRKQMEEMMAKQGVGMNVGSGNINTLKMCIPPEMANRPPVEQRQGCTNTFSQSGKTHNFSFKCVNPPSDGEGQFVFTDAENYTGKMRINTMNNGKKETMEMQSTAKFLSANCGAIKPMPALGK